MRRILGMALVLMILCATTSVFAQSEQESELTVGTLSGLSGSFYSSLWGNNTSDMDVRGLIHGCGTVAWQQAGHYAVNETAVTSFDTGIAANGDKTYRFVLNEALKWNNGEPVTAADYVFTVLLQSSPEMAALGVSTTGFSQLAGWEAFAANSGAPFSGVRLLGEHSFSLTVKAEYLPYFYELMYINVEPTPLNVIAPTTAVADDGLGAYLTSEDGGFTTEALRLSLLGENGYVQKPQVTCGLYNLESYDAQAQVATFVRNPYSLGNFEGRIPEVERLIFRAIEKENMISAFQSGEVDILHKVVDGSVISDGLAQVNADQARSVSYARSGLAFLSFACEDETMAELSVRRAIAMSVDVDALCSNVLGGYAVPVYGYYGLGQWMTSQEREHLNELDRYGYDVTGAKGLLIDDGWIYNADGQPFAEGTDDMRWKMDGGRMVPLEIRLALSKESAGAAFVVDQLTLAAAALGARLSVEELSFDELLKQYYRQTERTGNVFLLGTNFSFVFDPSEAFNIGDEYQGVFNTTGLRDEELMKRAYAMRGVAAGDIQTYLESWFSFQERWAEVLPMAPLYSNVYFDFTRPGIYGYQINTHWSWSAAVAYVSLTEPDGGAIDAEQTETVID